MPPKVAQMIKEQEEQKIFKEFEELGWRLINDRKYGNHILNLQKFGESRYLEKEMFINLKKKNYCFTGVCTYVELQLLHKLFTIWGWFDE